MIFVPFGRLPATRHTPAGRRAAQKSEIRAKIFLQTLDGLTQSSYICNRILPGGQPGRRATIINILFNPSFCQELVKRISCPGHPIFPSGTNDILVGDKRDPRGGQTRPSWGTNERLVGDKRQRLVSQPVAKTFDKEGQKTQKRAFV